jgi:hypothetical protein
MASGYERVNSKRSGPAGRARIFQSSGGLISERSLKLRNSPAVIFVQLLNTLVQGLKFTGVGCQICSIHVEPVLRRHAEKRIVDRIQSALKPFVTVGGVTHTLTTCCIRLLPRWQVRTWQLSLSMDCPGADLSTAKRGRNWALPW